MRDLAFSLLLVIVVSVPSWAEQTESHECGEALDGGSVANGLPDFRPARTVVELREWIRDGEYDLSTPFAIDEGARRFSWVGGSEARELKQVWLADLSREISTIQGEGPVSRLFWVDRGGGSPPILVKGIISDQPPYPAAFFHESEDGISLGFEAVDFDFMFFEEKPLTVLRRVIQALPQAGEAPGTSREYLVAFAEETGANEDGALVAPADFTTVDINENPPKRVFRVGPRSVVLAGENWVARADFDEPKPEHFVHARIAWEQKWEIPIVTAVDPARGIFYVGRWRTLEAYDLATGEKIKQVYYCADVRSVITQIVLAADGVYWLENRRGENSVIRRKWIRL